MRIAILVPEPDYPEPWRWAFDVEAAALAARRLRGRARRLDRGRRPVALDLVLPLVAWGYHLDYPRWLDFLDRAERERWPLVNPPALLRWNSDKAYLAELGDRGVSTVPTLAVEACCDADLEEARRRFRQRVAGDQAAGLGKRHGHAPARAERRSSRRQPRPADDRPAA